VIRKRLIILNRINKDGLTPIYLYYEYLEGEQRRQRKVNTGIKINPSKWSKKYERVLKSDPNHKTKNDLLIAFIHKYDVPIPKPSGKKKALLRKDITQYMLEYISYRKARGDKQTSYKEFITVNNRMIKFQNDIGKKIFFEDINLSFSDQLIIWMSKKGYDPNTIKKHFTTLKTFLFFYFKRQKEYGIQLSGEFQTKDFSNIQTHTSPPLPLTNAEFKMLSVELAKSWKRKLTRKEKVIQHLMLFQCSTGLRYSDLFRIAKDNIRNNIIFIEPKKTERTKKDNLCKIPINYYSTRALSRLGGETTKHKMSIQKYNKYIKQISKVMNINSDVLVKEYIGLGEVSEKIYKKHEILSSHNMRDTFITLAIKVKIDIPSIMKMTGQNSWTVMQKYVKLDEDHLIEEMDNFKPENIKKQRIPEHIQNPRFFLDQSKKQFIKGMSNLPPEDSS
jgi:site-specific recombinase XerD